MSEDAIYEARYLASRMTPNSPFDLGVIYDAARMLRLMADYLEEDLTTGTEA